MAGKRGLRRAWRRNQLSVRSLHALQAMLDEHERRMKVRVRVKQLDGLRDASSMQSLLHHQEEVMGWEVMGMRQLVALARVHGMIEASAALIEEAILFMEEASAARDAIRREGASSSNNRCRSAAEFARDEHGFGNTSPASGIDTALRSSARNHEFVPAIFSAAHRFAGEGSSNNARGLASDELGPAGRDPVPADPRLVTNDVKPLVRAAASTGLSTAEFARDEHGLGNTSPASGIDTALRSSARDHKFVPATFSAAHRLAGEGSSNNARGLASDELGPAGRDPVPADPRLVTNDVKPLVRAAASNGLSAAEFARDEHGLGNTSPALDPSARDLEFVPATSSAVHRLARDMLQAGTGRILEPSPALVHLAGLVFDAGSRHIVRVAEPRAPSTNSLNTDTAVLELADRMLEAGTGLRANALLPAPEIVELAARVVAGDSDYTPASHLLFARLLDSGAALRLHHLGGPGSNLQRAVQALGCQIEDIAGAVLTERHPTHLLLLYLRTVRRALERVLNHTVSQRDFRMI